MEAEAEADVAAAVEKVAAGIGLAVRRLHRLVMNVSSFLYVESPVCFCHVLLTS